MLVFHAPFLSGCWTIHLQDTSCNACFKLFNMIHTGNCRDPSQGRGIKKAHCHLHHLQNPAKADTKPKTGVSAAFRRAETPPFIDSAAFNKGCHQLSNFMTPDFFMQFTRPIFPSTGMLCLSTHVSWLRILGELNSLLSVSYRNIWLSLHAEVFIMRS